MILHKKKKVASATKKSTLKKTGTYASAKGLGEIEKLKIEIANLITKNKSDDDTTTELAKLLVKASLLMHIIQTLLYNLAHLGITYYDKRKNHQIIKTKEQCQPIRAGRKNWRYSQLSFSY